MICARNQFGLQFVLRSRSFGLILATINMVTPTSAQPTLFQVPINMVATLFQVAAQPAILSSQRDTNQVVVWVYRSTHATSLLRYATDDAHQPGISSLEDQTLLTASDTGHQQCSTYWWCRRDTATSCKRVVGVLLHRGAGEIDEFRVLKCCVLPGSTPWCSDRSVNFASLEHALEHSSLTVRNARSNVLLSQIDSFSGARR